MVRASSRRRCCEQPIRARSRPTLDVASVSAARSSRAARSTSLLAQRCPGSWRAPTVSQVRFIGNCCGDWEPRASSGPRSATGRGGDHRGPTAQVRQPAQIVPRHLRVTQGAPAEFAWLQPLSPERKAGPSGCRQGRCRSRGGLRRRPRGPACSWAKVARAKRSPM
jgi:hypothetical protein